MSPKQAVYQEMLWWTLPLLRNLATQPWWRRLRDRMAYFEAELIHNLPGSLFDEDFGEHDLWFLNVQAKWYHDRCSVRLSYAYPSQLERIRRLFELVPDELRGRLEWAGPVTAGASSGADAKLG